MSAVDDLLALLARFEPRGTLTAAGQVKRVCANRRAGELGQVAEKRRVVYEYRSESGAICRHTPFAGRLHPARCGAVQSQTRSVRLDTETSLDVAAALSFACHEEGWSPMPRLLAWLSSVAGLDAGNSRSGRSSYAAEFDEIWMKRPVVLPPHLERIPRPPADAVIDLAAEVLAEARFRRWAKPDELDVWRDRSIRIAELVIYALVDVEQCRRCCGVGQIDSALCSGCGGGGWLSIKRRDVAKALDMSSRAHALTTEPAYRWALSVMAGRLQGVSWAARKALRN